MSVTLKKDSWKIKDGNGTYRESAIFSTTLPEDAAAIVAEATSAIDAQQIRAATVVNETTDAIDTIMERVNDVVEAGTDTTLTQSGAAADAKVTGDSIEAMYTLFGNVEYWGEPDSYIPTSTATERRITLYQTRNRLHLNNTTPTAETTSITQRYYRINNGINFRANTDENEDTKRLALIEGHRYRLIAKKVSGSITLSSDSASLVLFIRDSDTTSAAVGSPALIRLQELTSETAAEFIAGSSNVNIILRTTNGVLCSNFIFEVYLIDLDISKNTQYLEFEKDSIPTEGSTNPITSDGTYKYLTDITEDIASTAVTISGVYIADPNAVISALDSETSPDRVICIQAEPNKTYRIKKDTVTLMRAGCGSSNDLEVGSILSSYTMHSASSDPLIVTTNNENYYIYIQLFTDTDSAGLLSIAANTPSLRVYEYVQEEARNILFLADGSEELALNDYQQIRCVVSSSNTLTHNSAGSYLSKQIPVNVAWKAIKIVANASASSFITFVKDRLPWNPNSGTSMSDALATGEIGRHENLAGTTNIYSIPSDATYIVISTLSGDVDISPQHVYALSEVAADVDILQTEVDSKLDATYDEVIDWEKAFGDANCPLGWTRGLYNATGTPAQDEYKYMRSYSRMWYTGKTGDVKLKFEVPAGYHASISEYDADGSNGQRYGNPASSPTAIEIPVTVGHQYKFCVGKWDDNDVEDYLNEEFLSTLVLTVKKSFAAWQKEQDARINSLLGSDIPDYYIDSGYLQERMDTVTNIQKTLLSDKTDSFFFISDYHIRTNQGHSLAIIREIAKHTGIQKMFFSGDAGGRIGTTAAAYTHAMQRSAGVWSDLSGCVEEFYGALGNHEWIEPAIYHLGAMFGNYLNRYKHRVKEMTPNGSYYIEDPVCKIRYYFIQDTGGAQAMDFDWLGKSLETIDDGWYIAVIAHHAFIPAAASEAEYDGVLLPDTAASWKVAKIMNQILDAYQSHTSLTVTLDANTAYDGTYSWDFSNSSGGGALGIFSGHWHHGTLFPVDDPLNEWSVPVFRASTDSMQSGTIFDEIDGQKVPWYWEDGIIGGTKIAKTIGTTNEQCFYIVQIDMTSKTVYITAFGGDHDWQFTFN